MLPKERETPEEREIWETGKRARRRSVNEAEGGDRNRKRPVPCIMLPSQWNRRAQRARRRVANLGLGLCYLCELLFKDWEADGLMI